MLRVMYRWPKELLETPYTLAEWLAPQAEIYTDLQCNHWSKEEYNCGCRGYWVLNVAGRMRASVAGFFSHIMDGRTPTVMKLETPEDLAEWLADTCNIYVDPRCHNPNGHEPMCACRVFWIPELAARIRQSVANEKALAVLEVLDKLAG